jgi:hypothetical protein
MVVEKKALWENLAMKSWIRCTKETCKIALAGFLFIDEIASFLAMTTRR